MPTLKKDLNRLLLNLGTLTSTCSLGKWDVRTSSGFLYRQKTRKKKKEEKKAAPKFERKEPAGAPKGVQALGSDGCEGNQTCGSTWGSVGSVRHVAVAQETGAKWNPGKWKHGLNPA